MSTGRYTQMGCALVAICLLVVALSCGVGGVAVQQRIVTLPSVNLQLGVYRVTASTQTLRTRPVQRFYIVWIFIKTSQLSRVGPPAERGEQVLQIPLRVD